jgi:hypothetical protein
VATLAWLAAGGPALAADGAPRQSAREIARYATEANQGAAGDARHVYAVSNSAVAKYDKRTGAKVAEWRGSPAQVPHLNACARVGGRLACANSNYPATPHTSSVEFLDAATMTHVGSVALGPGVGSLTWVDRRGDRWWAGFANYDARGGEAGRDHRWTTVVEFDDQWRRLRAWLLPASVLERLKPYSNSGGGWGVDGLLYLTGHDAPELYVLRLPAAGATLEHVATLDFPVNGQAIAWDRTAPRTLYGLNRATREVVGMQVPPVALP